MFSVFLGLYLEAELLSQMESLCLTFGGAQFSKLTIPFYMASSNVRGFGFSTSLPTLIVVFS